ncbi:MAG: four helix bundle protein [Akkermansia sp.]|nr:four helix bundle protein [Akkermansia sp.]MDO5464792.1 four helix bundle protein [Akkermansia sp.]
MNKDELKTRTKLFALRIIRLSEKLQQMGGSPKIISHQLLRSGTSVGANYRAACIAKSDNDYLHKLKICEEEADETTYWLELLIESQLIPGELLTDIHDESRQITAIITASIKTKRRNMGQ